MRLEPASSVDLQEILRRASGLLESGRHADGAKILRLALDRAPTDTSVGKAVAHATTLARTWLTLGQGEPALALLEPLAQSKHANGALLMLCGHALMSLGRKSQAEEVFRRWFEKEPENREVALRLAAVLADSGKPAEAETVVRADIERHGPAPEAAFVLGRALLGLARFDEAEAEFRKVVHERPDHQTAHANLMELIWMRSGNVYEASRAIDQALRMQPDLHALRVIKARLLASARMPREALAEIDAGLAMAGPKPALLESATTIALDFDGALALHYAEQLQALAPQDRASRIALGNASLATGHAQAALEIAESLHRSAPTDGRALAMCADALRMLGDERYRELLDYDHFVRAGVIDTPADWPDLPSYLADLVAALGRAHVLNAHPIGNSLRQGSQIQLTPERSAEPAIRVFPQAIDGPIRRYMEAIGHGSDPMRRRNTGRYRLSGMWSVRLRANGFHVNHYHPQGWISSACYLDLPPAVARGGGEGWLKFGEPAFPTNPALGAEYFLKPEPGLLALFPSYMWHGTVPFSGTERDSRLTIAFDIVPSGMNEGNR